MKKVLLLTDFTSGYSRSLLKGIVRYAKEFGPWIFYRMPLYYRELHGDAGVVKWAKQWNADAIVAQLTNMDFNILHQLNIPIIVQNYKDRHPLISNLTGDYFNTGSLAADFFLQRGFRNFAYYGYQETVWMRERGNGFREKLNHHGHTVYQYDEFLQSNKKYRDNAKMLTKWLMGLPKPIALFACDDYFALKITEICKIIDIEVPNDIAVLGVDNDSLLCNISNPQLSSIELDVQNGGYEAGKLLHQLMEDNLNEPVNIVVNPIRVVQRESTEKYATSDKHTQDILTYINNNFMNELSVESILQTIPSSRRVLEKRFKKETGITIYQYLQKVRVEMFADLLINTDLPLIDAASKAGFNDYKNVSRVFVKLKKMNPLQYRRKYKLMHNDLEDDESSL